MSEKAAKRRKPTLKQQVEILPRQGVICAGTGDIVHEVEWDHRIPAELHVKGGIDPNRTDNWQALEPVYHRTVKTPADQKVIARVKRRSGETGQRARRSKRGGSSIQTANNLSGPGRERMKEWAEKIRSAGARPGASEKE